ncbi:MAG: bifunctional precorrin-2 dehydrogenase/sirohydrochlorin ferrochelatase [Labilithrix sp.]|nr:bifunctional precorrin-2 dehydrogenase/sirohydrochlorin ferrochelatase [Labilithrix sp.]
MLRGAMSDTRVLLPLFVDVEEKRVLVVGGGAVGARKAQELAAAGARIHVVAEAIGPDVEGPRVTTERRRFEETDVEGAWLVVAATNDAATQREIARAADRARVFCVAVDDPDNASAYGGAVVRRGPVTVAISTSGEAPALARLLRELIEQMLPEADYVEAARALRETWKSEGTPMSSRFAELVRAFKERAR